MGHPPLSIPSRSHSCAWPNPAISTSFPTRSLAHVFFCFVQGFRGSNGAPLPYSWPRTSFPDVISSNPSISLSSQPQGYPSPSPCIQRPFSPASSGELIPECQFQNLSRQSFTQNTVRFHRLFAENPGWTLISMSNPSCVCNSVRIGAFQFRS